MADRFCEELINFTAGVSAETGLNVASSGEYNLPYNILSPRLIP